MWGLPPEFIMALAGQVLGGAVAWGAIRADVRHAVRTADLALKLTVNHLEHQK